MEAKPDINIVKTILKMQEDLDKLNDDFENECRKGIETLCNQGKFTEAKRYTNSFYRPFGDEIPFNKDLIMMSINTMIRNQEEDDKL